MREWKAVVLVGPDPAVDKLARWRIVDQRYGVSYGATARPGCAPKDPPPHSAMWRLPKFFISRGYPQSNEKAQRALKKRGFLLV
jgi:hypothetical protein